MAPDALSTYLLTQGVLGFVVLVLGYVVVKLYNRIEKLQADKDALTEARRMDYKDTIKEVTDVMNDTSQNLRILSEKIEVGKQIDSSRKRR